MKASLSDFAQNFDIVPFSFSSYTCKVETLRTIEEKLERRRRNLIGGHSGKKVIIFVDDVNMPAYDEFGTQMPIEFLRQICNYSGFYDQSELFWKSISDVTLACVAAPPEGGRKVITSRFTNNFLVVSIPPTSEESLSKIFGTILKSHYTHQNSFRKEVV